MREYYLFHIKQDIYDLHKNDGYMLYQTLENIYKLQKKNLNYGFSLYKQLCIPFNLEILKDYFNKKYDGHIKKNGNSFKIVNNYICEETLVKLNISRIYIKSNINLPRILKVFEFYNQKIFVCDFKNRDFFWLSRQYNKNNRI